jgi:hypothetical protein
MKIPRDGFRPLQHEQRMVPTEDSYRLDAKLPDPSRCPDCLATYRNGRWTWKKAPADASVHRCPACQRIHDRFPAGYVALRGRFKPEEREELIRLVRAREEHARSEHPLQRIIDIETVAAGLLVTTTDAHLARAIAHAVREARQGTLEMTYSREENLVRATWRAPREVAG